MGPQSGLFPPSLSSHISKHISQVGEVGAAVWAMQKANQPHNLLFTPKHVYVWPKPLQRPARCFGPAEAARLLQQSLI